MPIERLITRLKIEFPHNTQDIDKIYEEHGKPGLQAIDRHKIQALWAIKFAKEPEKAIKIINDHGLAGARCALLYRDTGIEVISKSSEPKKVISILEEVGHPAPALFKKHGDAALLAFEHPKIGKAFTSAIAASLIEPKDASLVIEQINAGEIEKAQKTLHERIRLN